MFVQSKIINIISNSKKKKNNKINNEYIITHRKYNIFSKNVFEIF